MTSEAKSRTSLHYEKVVLVKKGFVIPEKWAKGLVVMMGLTVMVSASTTRYWPGPLGSKDRFKSSSASVNGP